MNSKVVIIGAGIGGLTAAHFLVGKVKEIHIYEKNSIAGGLARTENGPGGGKDTREISWRVYFHFYYHLFDIMKQIPSIDDKTVYEHLVRYRNVFTPEIDPISFLSFGQIFKIVKTLFSSNSRIDYYDRYPWRDFIGDDNSEIPQWLGMDRFKGSTTSVQRIGIEQHLRKTKGIEDCVLDGPTNQVWIDPWVSYLRKKGVMFHFSQPVSKITVNDKTITEIMVGDTRVTADLYVLGLPIEVLSRLVPDLVPDGYRLSEFSKQMQVGYQLYLDDFLSLGEKDGIPYQSFLVRNSPWALIVESKTISWNEADHIHEVIPSFGSINGRQEFPKLSKLPTQWSITACQVDVPGIRHKKSLVLCNEQEMREEILAELYDNKNLMERLKRENPNVSDVKTILENAKWSFTGKDFSVMSSFTLPREMGGELKTTEPKFSNNIGTKSIRPSVKLGTNVYLSTAYVKETIDIFSMEAAVIGGKTVAYTILGLPKPDFPPRPYAALEPFRKIDEVLFRFGLPDIFLILFIILIIFLLYWTVKKL